MSSSLDKVFQNILQTEENVTSKKHQLHQIRKKLIESQDAVKKMHELAKGADYDMEMKKSLLAEAKVNLILVEAKCKHYVTEKESIAQDTASMADALANLKKEKEEVCSSFTNKVEEFIKLHDLTNSSRAAREQAGLDKQAAVQSEVDSLHKEVTKMQKLNHDMVSLTEKQLDGQQRLKQSQGHLADLQVKFDEVFTLCKKIAAERNLEDQLSSQTIADLQAQLNEKIESNEDTEFFDSEECSEVGSNTITANRAEGLSDDKPNRGTKNIQGKTAESQRFSTLSCKNPKPNNFQFKNSQSTKFKIPPGVSALASFNSKQTDRPSSQAQMSTTRNQSVSVNSWNRYQQPAKNQSLNNTFQSIIDRNSHDGKTYSKPNQHEHIDNQQNMSLQQFHSRHDSSDAEFNPRSQAKPLVANGSTNRNNPLRSSTSANSFSNSKDNSQVHTEPHKGTSSWVSRNSKPALNSKNASTLPNILEQENYPHTKIQDNLHNRFSAVKRTDGADVSNNRYSSSSSFDWRSRLSGQTSASQAQHPKSNSSFEQASSSKFFAPSRCPTQPVLAKQRRTQPTTNQTQTQINRYFPSSGRNTLNNSSRQQVNEFNNRPTLTQPPPKTAKPDYDSDPWDDFPESSLGNVLNYDDKTDDEAWEDIPGIENLRTPFPYRKNDSPVVNKSQNWSEKSYQSKRSTDMQPDFMQGPGNPPNKKRNFKFVSNYK